MDRRRMSDLPTERGQGHQPYFNVPQYMQPQNISTDSVGSCDSFATQVPLPFHLPQDRSVQYNPQQNWGSPISPNFPQDGQFSGFALRSNVATNTGNGQLNPTSAEYVPSNYAPSHVDASFSSRGSSYPSYPNEHFSRQGSISSVSSYPHMDQSAQMAYQPQDYQGGNMDQSARMAYQPQDYQGNMAASGYYDGHQQQLSPDFAPQAFRQMGHAPAGNEYSAYGQMHQYASYDMPSPIPERIASPTPSFAGHVSAAWGSLPPVPSYGSGQAVGYGGYSQGSNYGVSNPAEPANNNTSSFFSGSNNKQKVYVYDPPKEKDLKVKRKSKKAAPSSLKLTSFSSATNTAQPKGGPVVPPASKIASEGHFDKHSTRASSRASYRSEARSNSVASKDKEAKAKHVKVSNSATATPGQNHRVLGLEFASERRGAETPQLLATRGRSMSAADPAQKFSITSWLENTPTLENSNREEKTIKRRGSRSPPKMMPLRPASGVTSFLKPIREGEDPFMISSALSIRNPFTSIGPVRGTLVGRPGMSKELAILTQNGTIKPSDDVALNRKNLPFTEYCRDAKTENWGVIKIKNIPYNVNRPEVLAFLGRNAKIIDENQYEPVHIIMERVTSKTLDCYVEFISLSEAAAAVNRFETNKTGGRGGRLGQRHVEVELSCQEELMNDLFPKAKNVTWEGSRPEIKPRDPNDQYNSGFQGFISREELVMLVKHVEAPQRSPFSKDCPQRPFECIISTLLKFPWYMVDYITMKDRQILYDTTFELLELLLDRVNNQEVTTNLNHMLLKRVWKAALKCPGFTPTMKDNIVILCHVDETIAREMGMAPYAALWKDLWAIGAKAGAPSDLVLWYIAIIREATEAQKKHISLAEQARIGDDPDERKLFGDLNKWINHDRTRLANMTLAQVAEEEWGAIEAILRLALGGTGN